MNVPILAWTPGLWEMILLFAVVLILFGSKRLPKLARSIGSSITEFKKGIRGESEEDRKKLESSDEEEEEKVSSD